MSRSIKSLTRLLNGVVANGVNCGLVFTQLSLVLLEDMDSFEQILFPRCLAGCFRLAMQCAARDDPSLVSLPLD